MNRFKICKYIYNKIACSNINFFWYNNIDRDYTKGPSSIHIIAFKKIRRPKCEGDIGIKKPENVNVAFLVKQD